MIIVPATRHILHDWKDTSKERLTSFALALSEIETTQKTRIQKNNFKDDQLCLQTTRGATDRGFRYLLDAKQAKEAFTILASYIPVRRIVQTDTIFRQKDTSIKLCDWRKDIKESSPMAAVDTTHDVRESSDKYLNFLRAVAVFGTSELSQFIL